MLRTALLTGLLALAGYASAAWLTHDFQVWTAEGARRLEVAQQPVPLPPVTVEGPGIAAQPLPALLGKISQGRQVEGEANGATLVGFIYTRCQTVCLSLGSSFQQLQAALHADRAAGAAPKVRLLSISFDGLHDTPAVLQSYAHKLQADPAVWSWVRVPDTAEQHALLQRLGVVVVPDGRGDYEHNAAFLLIDAQGRMVRVFDLAEQQLALDAARHLAKGGQL
jgi:protein SCO1/2